MSVKEKTLELTNVLSDPTRYTIYEYLIKAKDPVTVKEVSEEVGIHPNVARLHLTKLTDVKLIDSYINQEKRSGRPSRLYVISKEAREISFPYRDYKLLSSITLEAIAKLGDTGRAVLAEVGADYGKKMIEQLKTPSHEYDILPREKARLLSETSEVLGLYASFEYDEDEQNISYTIHNCPFKELLTDDNEIVCQLHQEFLKGMFQALFTNIKFDELTNMVDGCHVCSYKIKVLA